jgi:uncharacterized coiled-coil protein SlyX
VQTGDARLAVVEARVEEQGQMVNGLRDAIVSLEARMDRRFEAIDRRFEQIDQRFLGLDQRLDSLDSKMSRQFVWIVGIQISSLIAVVGVLGGVIAALLAR